MKTIMLNRQELDRMNADELCKPAAEGSQGFGDRSREAQHAALTLTSLTIMVPAS